MYFIHVHYEATEINVNFPGEVQDWYYGKHNEMIGHNLPDAEHLKYWAMTNKGAATRALKFHKELADWEMKAGWWKVSCELITM